MRKQTIIVPPGITKLSQWTEFGNYLPAGKFVLNKKVTGCGATTYFLECSVPVILCSHRTELLECKARSPRHIGKVHLFKSSKDRSPNDLSKNMKRLHDYLDNCAPNPFTGEYPVPKILVTTDSLGHVLTVLHERNILDKFCVVSDEMQCIFTDSVFKGSVVLEYLTNLQYVQNVVFLSATPYLESYLDGMDEFKDLPYLELEWPESVVDDVSISPYYVKNLYDAAKAKIDFFKTHGFFEENGYHRATQGVFFFNSVIEIIKLIKNCNLSPSDVNVICSSSNEKNRKKLRKIGLTIGGAQGENEVHKTYTFVTKCAYEGVDFYHPNAYTYIFSNPNLSNMSMDLSIDLIQILGRQRLDTNPWKVKATIFYQTTKENFKISWQDFQDFVKLKESKTARAIQEINSESDQEYKGFRIRMINALHLKNGGYTEDYVSFIKDPVTDEEKAVLNRLVRISDERAWDIRNSLYENKYQVLKSLTSNFKDVNQRQIGELNKYFIEHKVFTDRMKFYCEFRDLHPELTTEIIGAVTIPIRYHEYYDKYGTERMRSVSYRESEFEKKLEPKPKVTLPIEELLSLFPIGTVITNKKAKSILQEYYGSKGIQKTAKATDLNEYFDVWSCKVLEDGKSLNGIKILKVK